MENAAVLVIDDKVFDISGCVQRIEARDKETGNVKYAGCGVVIFRPNHINGDLIVFLSRQGSKHMLGNDVEIYNKSSWSDEDYLELDMVADKSLRVIQGYDLPLLLTYQR